jgi:hypothetical protein
MATITTGYTWVNAEQITSTKLNNTAGAATISGIVNADISAAAAIADSKLAQITTASKVSGAALTSLTSIPGAAGVIPGANIMTRGTFVDGDLSTGVLTVTHSKALSAPYSVSVQVFDNTAKQIIPDVITGLTNTFTIDLTSYGTLSGTWGYAYVA